MKDLKVKVDSFKLGKFIKDIIGFLAGQGDDPLWMLLRYDQEDKEWYLTDDMENESELKKEVLKNGSKVYFLFSGPLCDFSLPCADEMQYDVGNIPKKDAIELNDMDTIGWTMECKDDKLFFNTGVSYPGMMSSYDVRLVKDMKFFEKPMKKFLQKYISK